MFGLYLATRSSCNFFSKLLKYFSCNLIILFSLTNNLFSSIMESNDVEFTFIPSTSDKFKLLRFYWDFSFSKIKYHPILPSRLSSCEKESIIFGNSRPDWGRKDCRRWEFFLCIIHLKVWSFFVIFFYSIGGNVMSAITLLLYIWK